MIPRLAVLGLLVLTASGATCQHRESQRSRDVLNCVYAAQYGPGNFTAKERNIMVEACGK